MAEYSSNLLINPYADEPITTGWTATENAEVISGGYLGAAFRINSPGYLEQTIPVELFGEGAKGIQLSCRVRFINNALPIYAKIVVYLRLQITTADGIVTLFMPCQATIMPGASGWILFEKTFDEPLREITAASFRVYSVDENVAVDLDNISVALDITATEAEQALNDAISYNNLGLEEHLNDITNSHLSDEQKYGLTGGAQRVRSIKLGMETNVRIANRNLYGQLPIVKLEAIREQAPIITPLFWTELLVKTEPNVTASSVAVQRDETGVGRVYVAYITDGKLCVRSAQFAYPVSDMLWEDEAEITDCSKCALDFDGHFVTGSNKKIEYYTDELPWLFYTTTSGELMAGVLGGAYESLVGANVTAMDAVRGVASKYKDIDQGLLVFYVIAGNLYYRDLVAGVWGGQTSVSIAPADIVSVRAERTFDYRIVLQVTDTSGSLHEIFTKMESSGWQGLENIFMSVYGVSALYDILYSSFSGIEYLQFNISATGYTLYALSPVMKTAYNVGIEVDYAHDYGYAVVLEWDERVFDAVGHETSFAMVDEASAVFGCTLVEKTGEKEITLLFQNFNNAIGDLTLSYTPGTMMGDIVAVEADNIVFTPTGLVPFAIDPPVPISVINTIEWEAG